MTEPIDCLIVGGGPAGLTAAIYAARFRLSVMVVDSGASRAAMIPCTRNHAGFPDGISGAALLSRMRAQALQFGVAIVPAAVTRLSLESGGFVAEWIEGRVSARAVILATGVTNRRPPITAELHDAAVAAGRLRYCPVCDGFEVIDQEVAVIGTGPHGVREAQFLRAFTPRVTLISPGERHELTEEQQASLRAAGVRLLQGPAACVAMTEDGLSVSHGGELSLFHAVYPALGSDIHSTLAEGLGARLTGDGCIVVDAHQRTSVAGLFAAGDVVIGLDQISHAMGEAGVAATTLRNDLAEKDAARAAR